MSIPVILLFIICFASIVVGALYTGLQIFKIASLDAEARGLKHPKLWGFLSASGNNSSGLIMYFIVRKNYPVESMSREVQLEIQTRKKRVGVGIVFLALGAIGFVIAISLM